MNKRMADTGIQQDRFELSADDLDLVAELAKPNIKDSTILTLDAVLTLMRLFKAEAGLALGTLPALFGLGLARGPAYLITWLSFGLFAACAAYVYFGSLLAGAGTFFVLQLGATAVLEWRIHRLHQQIDFPESRKGLAVLQASLKERLSREHAP
jgi:hypothetical protein